MKNHSKSRIYIAFKLPLLFIVTDFIAVFVIPPDVKHAVIITVCLLVTSLVVSTPEELIDAYAEFSLQVGMTVKVEPSVQLSVAV
jgi:hypothetical protein